MDLLQSSELTYIQRKMFICNQLPVYRLPFIYEIPEPVSLKEVCTALLITIQECQTLQTRYTYDAEHRMFNQVYHRLDPHQFEIPQIYLDEHPEIYLKQRKEMIDLTKEYPWRTQFAEYKQKMYLLIEFHHICIDGWGIRNFESMFMDHLAGRSRNSPDSDFGFYQRINELQTNKSSFTKEEFLRLSGQNMHVTTKKGHLERLIKQLKPEQFQHIDQISTLLKVTRNSVFQGLWESVLEQTCTGSVYGTIGNWRMSMGAFHEIGCFVQMQSRRIVRGRDILATIKQISLDNLSAFAERSMEPPTRCNMDHPVVYSYEEDMFRYFQYIPADNLNKFELYIRVFLVNGNAQIEIEYNPSQYSEEQIRFMLDLMDTTLKNCLV
ncbi:condensation domain-containing protein [Paenibacillus sp. FSL R5-0749]|uniref:condensation domain-containing protein n=1 Tax=Paenibacillus sp. FSL R5-0749 TaxID=2921657 RepID=UPI00315AABEB